MLDPDNSKRPFYGFKKRDVEDRSVGGWGGGGMVDGGGDGLVERKDV